MGQGISVVAGFAIGVAISPFPIIAVILMLFSSKAKVNGPMFAVGWMGALALVGAVAYSLAAYYLLAGERAEHALDDLKGWLGTHNDALMAVLLLVFGVDLAAKGLGLLA